MPTPTWDIIEEKVLSSAQSSVTFSNIVGTYKDLELEIVCSSASSNTGTYMQFNSDTGNNYSNTLLYGAGTSPASLRRSSQTAIGDIALVFASKVNYSTLRFMSYANTNVYKTVLVRYGMATDEIGLGVGLWRSSAAITSILLYPGSSIQYAAGSTFRLWGIAG